MANVTFFDSPVALSIADLYAAQLEVSSATAQKFTLGGKPGDDLMIVYGGKNFQYDASGITGGTVQSLTVFYFDEDAGKYVEIQRTTGLNTDFAAIGDTFGMQDSDKAADAAIKLLFPGADKVTGSATADIFTPGEGDDTVSSGAGNDTIYASGGRDSIDAGSGNDLLAGGLGKDTLFGGDGKDVFVFGAADDKVSAKNADLILDFIVKDDQFQLYNDVFKQVGPEGKLAQDAFFVGSAAHDDTDRIIYNKATGDLFYDPDGDGRAKAILFATIDDGLKLKASDFDIVS